MRHRALLWPAAAALLLVGCAEAPTRPVASATGRPAPTGLARSLTGTVPIAELGLAAAAAADARERIVPTLPAGEAADALAAALQGLEAALDASDLAASVGALDQARAALGALAGSEAAVPAEVGAVELVLDRAAGLLAAPSVPVVGATVLP